MDRPTVLIVSDSPSFPAALTARWQSERNAPAFTLMQGDLCHHLDAEAFDLAVLGDIRSSSLASVLEATATAANPALLVAEEDSARLHAAHPHLKVIRKTDGWMDLLVALSAEVLLRRKAEALARRTQQANAALECEAALGRYMLDVRHGLNNALTSVLGNSELLLLDPLPGQEQLRPQIETIRNMAIRMHEVFQRFSSLEKELRATEQQAVRETHAKSKTVAASVS
jgi:signal transduction histidine kinase